MTNLIRKIYGYVYETRYPGMDVSKSIDKLIQSYADKQQKYSTKLSKELDKELKKRGWMNAMGETCKIPKEIK